MDKEVKKVLIVIGTRPEAIKMIPVINILKKSKLFDTKLCITAQHREMLDQVLDIFNISPDYDLDIMKEKQDLFHVTSNILNKIKNVYIDYSPDLILVHGDTATSFVSSLAAYYMKIPISHIEAGLRTNDLFSPWPEEGYRQLTGRLAKYHFAPTLTSKNNLINEGIDDKNIFVTGNTVIDTLHFALKQIDDNKIVITKIKEEFKRKQIFLNEYSNISNEQKRKFILITGHRRENFGTGFINICKAIKLLAIKYPSVDFIYPVHLNPNVKEVVFENLGVNSGQKNIKLIDPLEYLPFIYLLSKSYIVLTDSGGIQEEAPSLGKPVLVMRNTTERPEAVKAGTVKLVGTNVKFILEEVSQLLDNLNHYNSISKIHNPYGNGTAAKKIFKTIKEIIVIR